MWCSPFPAPLFDKFSRKSCELIIVVFIKNLISVLEAPVPANEFDFVGGQYDVIDRGGLVS